MKPEGGFRRQPGAGARSVVTSAPAENRKLDKKRATTRIDGIIALTMALAAGPSA